MIGKDKAKSVVLFLNCRFELNVHVVIRHRNTPTLELVILVLNRHNCLILALETMVNYCSENYVFHNKHLYFNAAQTFTYQFSPLLCRLTNTIKLRFVTQKSYKQPQLLSPVTTAKFGEKLFVLRDSNRWITYQKRFLVKLFFSLLNWSTHNRSTAFADIRSHFFKQQTYICTRPICFSN